MSLFGSYRDRRRRNLAEDSSGEAIAASPVSSKPVGKSERYSSGARRENHRHTTDFLPRRKLPLALWFCVSLLIIAGLLAGFVNSGSESFAALGLAQLMDASQGGSLAGWCSSLVLGLAALGCLVVYSVRRFKVDDYRGRYRLWLWCAAACSVMSVDATANLHAPFSRAMATATDWSLDTNPAVWWIGIWGLLLAVLALRLVLETRECRTATAAIIVVSILWTIALAISCGWILLGSNSAIIAIGCRLIGQATLLLAIGIYGRHVLLDSEGLLAVRPAKPKREKQPKKSKVASTNEIDASAGKTSRMDSAHKLGDKQGGMQSHVQSVSSGGRSSVTSSNTSFAANRSKASHDDEDNDDRYSNRSSSYNRFDDDDEEDHGDQEKLSKAERKRLRKMARRQQREEE